MFAQQLSEETSRNMLVKYLIVGFAFIIHSDGATEQICREVLQDYFEDSYEYNSCTNYFKQLEKRMEYEGELVLDGVVPRDCSDIHKHWTEVSSGTFRIFPAGGKGYEVYCDMKLDGGGWTVFQRRQDGSEKFDRTWQEYKYGFGDLSREHWLGNKALHEITAFGLYEMRINLVDFDDNRRYAKYNNFYISNEADGYRLKCSGYNGNAGGDSLAYSNGMKFTTKDRDNDYYSWNCATIQKYDGAWWFNSCFRAFLNGKYRTEPTGNEEWSGLIWNHWHGSKYSLKGSTMMLRRHSQGRR